MTTTPVAPPLTNYTTCNDSSPATQVWDIAAGAFVGVADAGFASWLSQLTASPVGGPFYPYTQVLLSAASSDAGATTTFTISDNSLLTTGEKFNFSGTGGLYDGNFTITKVGGTGVKISVAFAGNATGYMAGAMIAATAADLVANIDSYNRSLFNNGRNFGAASLSSAVDLQLSNPLSQITRVTMTAASKKVILPQMNLPGSVAAGVALRVVNIGANDFDLYLFGGASRVITVAFASGGLGGAVDFIQVPGGTLTVQSGNIAVLDLYPEMQTTGTSHQVQLKAGGTQADLSATGGTHKFLRQNAVGAAVDVVQPASTDLSDLPVPVASGGTGVATLTGLALGAGAAAFTGVGYTAPTAYTPTDQSGAGLTFTTIDAAYEKVDNIIRYYGVLTFPVTASGANATISIPVNAVNAQRGFAPGSGTTGAAVNSFVPFVNGVGVNTMTLFDQTARAFITNAQMSGQAFRWFVSYPVS